MLARSMQACVVSKCSSLLLQLRQIASCKAVPASFATTASFTSLPIIDVGPLVEKQNRDVAAVQRTGQALHRACRDVGFFYISNHGVAPEVYQGVLSGAHKWFSLPVASKEQLLLSPDRHYRGYQPLGTNVTRHETGFTPDLHEALDYFKEQDPAAVEAAGITASPIHGLNPWPDQLPEFSRALQTYIQHMQQLGADLLRGIACGLGLNENAFGGAFASPDSSYYVCRVIYYPPLHSRDSEQAAAAARRDVDRQVQLSCGEHTDYGLLTLVNQDCGVTALQVKNSAGQWVDAAPLPGTFVCNIGDMFEVLTNGLYRPTLHRVLNASAGSPRVSVPFFYEPAFDAIVEPVPELCRHQDIKVKPVRYGAHLEGKVLTNFEGL